MSKRPPPLDPLPQRKRCPVCGDVSYSRAGIHPQCAQRQADAQRRPPKPRPARQAATAAKAAVLKPWHKRCPKCSGQIHLRKTVCSCGHVFQS